MLRRGRAGIATSRPRWRRSRPSLPDARGAVRRPRSTTRPSATASRPRGSGAVPAACSASRSRAGAARRSATTSSSRTPTLSSTTSRSPARPTTASRCATAGRRRPADASTSSRGTTTSTTRSSACTSSRSTALSFGPADVGREWLDHLPFTRVYTAERAAYRNLAARSRSTRDGDPPQPIPRVDRSTDPRGHLGLRLARAAAAGGPARVSRTRASLTPRTASTARCGWRG